MKWGFSAVTLVGGSTPGRGNVFARNPTTGIYGPVCDDNFALVDVSFTCIVLKYI